MLKMPRALPCAFALLAAAGAASAQQSAASSVTVFGVLDVAAGRVQLAGARSVWAQNSNALTTSRLGFMGSEDLGGGLRANFYLTHMLRPDTGDSGRFPGDAFWSSRATVGLSGNFGQINLGRMNSPLFFSLVRFDAHELASFAPVFLHTFPGLQPLPAAQAAPDSTINNGVQYATPTFGGFSASVHAGSAEVANSKQGRFGYNATYVAGPLALGLAGDVINLPTSVAPGVPGLVPGATRQTSIMGAAAYDLQVVKLSGIYMRNKQKTLDNEYRTWSLGATVPVGGDRIIASFARTDLDRGVGIDPHRQTFGLTYDHNLSKRTDVYLHALRDSVSTAATRGNSLIAGIRHRF